MLGSGLVYHIKRGLFIPFFVRSGLDRKDKSNFIEQSINILETYADIAVVNPVWNYQFTEAYQEAIAERVDFMISYGFCDQCYLIRTKEFQTYVLKHEYRKPKASPLCKV